MGDYFCHACKGRTGSYGHYAADALGSFYSCQEPDRYATLQERNRQTLIAADLTKLRSLVRQYPDDAARFLEDLHHDHG